VADCNTMFNDRLQKMMHKDGVLPHLDKATCTAAGQLLKEAYRKGVSEYSSVSRRLPDGGSTQIVVKLVS
jgi:hypothetical protein